MKFEIIFLLLPFVFCLEKDIIQTSVKVGKFKLRCTFTLISHNGAVNLKKSKLTCSPKKKKKKFVNYVLNGNLGKYKLSFSIKPNKITKAILELSGPGSGSGSGSVSGSGSASGVGSGTGSGSGSCSPGYTNICPPNNDNSCPASMSLACPANTASILLAPVLACTCLPTRGVEQDFAEGVSPLGSCYKGCICLSNHIVASQCNDEMTALLITGGRLGSTHYDAAEVVGKPSCSVPPLPEKLVGHLTFITNDETILTCGGLSGGTLSNTCQSLDLYSSSWILHSTLSSTRMWASYVVLPSGAYILGGGISLSGDDTSEHLPTGSTTWEPGPTLPFISKHACSVAIGKTKFLLIQNEHVQEYDTELQTWSAWPNLAQASILHSCAKLENKVIVAGGYWQGFGYKTSTEVIDIDTKAVQAGGPLHEARGYFGMATVSWPPGTAEKKVISFGGLMYYGNPSTRVDYDTIEVWNATYQKWEQDTITLGEKNNDFGYSALPLQLVCP